MKKVLAVILIVLIIGPLFLYAYHSSSEFKFELSKDGNYYIVVGVKNIKGDDVIIPDRYKKLPVWEIADRAFADCDAIKSITMTEILYVGSSVFYGCDNLTTVEMPCVVEMSSDVFNGCTTIEELTIPVDFLSYLGRSASRTLGKEAIKKITITAGVRTSAIRESAFKDCENLVNVHIAEGVTVINDSAFENCSNLQTVTLSNGLLEIGKFAFKGCSNLINIEIPNTVVGISMGAFRDCTKLSSIVIPDSVEWLGNAVFCKCTSLEEVTLSAQLKELPEYAFEYCPIISITIPQRVRRIYSTAFYKTSLETAYFEKVSGWAVWSDSLWNPKTEVAEDDMADSRYAADILRSLHVNRIKSMSRTEHN